MWEDEMKIPLAIWEMFKLIKEMKKEDMIYAKLFNVKKSFSFFPSSSDGGLA